MVVYVDIVFLTNFFLDFALLLTAAKVRGIRPNLWRVGLSSALGASYVVFMFIPSLSFFYTFVVKCLFSAAMIMTAFGYKSFNRFVGALAAFYVANAAAAGTIMGVHYLLQSSHEVWGGILFTQSGGARYAIGVSLWLVAAAGAVGIAMFRNVNAGAKRKEKKTEFLAEVEVRIDDREYRCTGLIDTGNHLYDPLTRTPVMVIEASVWSTELPPIWVKAIRAHEADRIVATEETSSFPWPERIRLVPYRGINGGTRFMLAVKPDRVTIRQGGQQTVIEKVLVGIDGGTLSADGLYQAIIHPAMVS